MVVTDDCNSFAISLLFSYNLSIIAFDGMFHIFQIFWYEFRIILYHCIPTYVNETHDDKNDIINFPKYMPNILPLLQM
mgnify:CR=1 FL=1